MATAVVQRVCFMLDPRVKAVTDANCRGSGVEVLGAALLKLRQLPRVSGA